MCGLFWVQSLVTKPGNFGCRLAFLEGPLCHLMATVMRTADIPDFVGGVCLIHPDVDRRQSMFPQGGLQFSLEACCLKTDSVWEDIRWGVLRSFFRQVSQYKTGKASLSAQGKRRYDKKQAAPFDPCPIRGPADRSVPQPDTVPHDSMLSCFQITPPDVCNCWFGSRLAF